MVWSGHEFFQSHKIFSRIIFVTCWCKCKRRLYNRDEPFAHAYTRISTHNAKLWHPWFFWGEFCELLATFHWRRTEQCHASIQTINKNLSMYLKLWRMPGLRGCISTKIGSMLLWTTRTTKFRINCNRHNNFFNGSISARNKVSHFPLEFQV